MFSGLTNQMSSLLSTVKGGSTDQEAVPAAAADGEAPQSPQQLQHEGEAAAATDPATGEAVPAGAEGEKHRCVDGWM